MVDSAARCDVRHHRVKRIAEMREPLLGQSAGDRQEIVAMLERHVRTVAVAAVSAEPLGKETLLRLTLVGEIAAKERPQRGVCVDRVVQPVDECFERSMASDALQEIAADEGAMRLRVGKESTVLHRALVTVLRSGNQPAFSFIRNEGSISDDAVVPQSRHMCSLAQIADARPAKCLKATFSIWPMPSPPGTEHDVSVCECR